MFEDVIKMLLQKKETLREEIEREFAERSAKIDALLDMAGYVPPVNEVENEVEAPQAESECIAVPSVQCTVY